MIVNSGIKISFFLDTSCLIAGFATGVDFV